MRVDWNEELRRAYDQGYWDARREFEHHLATRHQQGSHQHQSGGSRGDARQGGWEGSRMAGGGATGPSHREGDRSHGQSNYGRSVYGPEESGREDGWRTEMGGRGGSDQGRSRGYEDRGGAGYRSQGSERDYPAGDRRAAHEGRGEWRGGHARYDRDDHRDEHRGFFDKVGEEVRSWFDGDDRGSDDRSRDNRRWRESDR